MGESASSSASSGVQFGNNGGASGDSPLVMASLIFGGLLFLAVLVYAALHKK